MGPYPHGRAFWRCVVSVCGHTHHAYGNQFSVGPCPYCVSRFELRHPRDAASISGKLISLLGLVDIFDELTDDYDAQLECETTPTRYAVQSPFTRLAFATLLEGIKAACKYRPRVARKRGKLRTLDPLDWIEGDSLGPSPSLSFGDLWHGLGLQRFADCERARAALVRIIREHRANGRSGVVLTEHLRGKSVADDEESAA